MTRTAKTRDSEVAALLGETLTTVNGMEPGSEEVVFETASGRLFRMFHDQDCCENVSLNEVIGNPADLIGYFLLLAEVISSPEGRDDNAGSLTWTFYRFGTIRGYVTLRWLGESNGYYSEGVSFGEDV